MGVTNAVNYNKGCSLELTKTYECGNTQFTKVTNVEGIEIKRVEEVAVHPLSFKVHFCYLHLQHDHCTNETKLYGNK